MCKDGIADSDSDGYEEVGDKRKLSRPSAMELIMPNNKLNNHARTLWCEIPEVIQSNVLSKYLFKIQSATEDLVYNVS